jgi:polysaccharide deacetylase family protein (PEP-CTERM system associated)
MKNLLTVDLEDWFSVEVLKDALPPDTWDRQESVVERNTIDVLDLFDAHSVKATFFVLGWIADKHPELIQEVAHRGHEIACHSYYHRMVSSLTPDEFRRDTDMAINAIVKACSIMPIGYRSPTWGIKSSMTWAFDILDELGFEYDSSVIRTKHDLYGDPDAPQEPHPIKVASGGTFYEIPVITIDTDLTAVSGGGWLRHKPYWYTKKHMRIMNQRKMPMVVYFHPWELDQNLPEKGLLTYMKKKRGPIKDWVRQYMGVASMKIKVEKLLKDFEFAPIKDSLETFKARRRNTT